MPDYRELIGAFRDDTRLDEAARARLRASLGRRRSRVGAVGGVVVGLCAAIVLFALTRPAQVLEGELVSGPLTREVTLEVDGSGSASGTGREPVLAWDRGILAVEVEPDQGIRLSVQTDEATVRVIGTGFRVIRDALGTRVDVAHGKVEVDCMIGGPTLLAAGDTRTCPPRTAAGRLGRIRALQAAGADAEALLAEVDAALADPSTTIGVGPSVAAELRSVRLDLLLALGRYAEALALAEDLAATDGPRAVDHHRIAARLRLAAHPPDCAGAFPHLLVLRDAGQLGPDAPWLPLCQTESR